VLPRDTRLRLWCEHLGRARGDDADLVDATAGIGVLRAQAAALDEWNRHGRRGTRPVGRLRVHDPEPVTGVTAWWARQLHRWLVDPDGRPRRLRRAERF
jgi:hypothetical protein